MDEKTEEYCREVAEGKRDCMAICDDHQFSCRNRNCGILEEIKKKYT